MYYIICLSGIRWRHWCLRVRPKQMWPRSYPAYGWYFQHKTHWWLNIDVILQMIFPNMAFLWRQSLNFDKNSTNVICMDPIFKSLQVQVVTWWRKGDKLNHWWPNSVIYIDGLVQKRRKSSALAMELRLSCDQPSICPTRPLSMSCFGENVSTLVFISN